MGSEMCIRDSFMGSQYIIGGLDKYTDGDLLIDSKYAKERNEKSKEALTAVHSSSFHS